VHRFSASQVIPLISLFKLPSHLKLTYGIPFTMYLDAPVQISSQLNNSTTFGIHFCAPGAWVAHGALDPCISLFGYVAAIGHIANISRDLSGIDMLCCDITK